MSEIVMLRQLTRRPAATIESRMTDFSQWPHWLQVLIIAPHTILGFVATLLWWPKSKESRRRLGFVAMYLLVFFLVMRFVFHAR